MLAFAPCTAAQPTPTASDSIRATLDGLFDAMRASDSTGVRAAFLPSAALTSALRTASGDVRVVATPVDAFARSVGTPHADVYDERIYDVAIHHAGYLAMAWVPYTFYLGARKSHCGVNTVQLVRTPAGWKIAALMDSRERVNCPG